MICGQKVGLRSIEFSDLENLQKWRNRPDFRMHFREHRELSFENQKAWFERTMSNPNDFMFAIVDLESQNTVGACGLLYTNWIIRSADFSFYIGESGLYVDDQGLAEDACNLLINYGFKCLNLNKIWMELYEFDEKKISLFVNTFGFTQDGVLRENCFHNGRYWDSNIISLLRHEWQIA